MRNFPFLFSLFFSVLLKAQCPWTMTVSSQNNFFNLTCSVNTLTISAVHTCTNPVSYSWSGPGIVGSAFTQTIMLNQPGQYMLVISDNVTSCMDFLSFNVASTPPPGAVMISPSSGMTVTCANPNQSFTTSVFSSTTHIVHRWFDPNSVYPTSPTFTAVGFQSNYFPAIAGSHTLQVKDTLTGCVTNQIRNVTMNNTLPVFFVSPSNMIVNCANVNPQFTATAISPTANIKFEWYHPVNPQNPQLVQAGVQSVFNPQTTGTHTITVIDTLSGCISSATLNVYLNSSSPTFSVQSNNGYQIGCDPATTVSVTNLVITPGAAGSFTFLPPGYNYTAPFNFTSPNTPSVVSLPTPGMYTLVVQDDANFCQTAMQVWIVPSTTSLSLTYTLNSSGQVAFESTSTGTNSGTTYQWDFGDGTNGSGVSSNHNYSNGGIHNVTLQTSNPSCTSAPVPVNVNTIPCNAISSFSLFPSGTPQLWLASPDYMGNVINAVWSWGDGTFTSGLYPSHAYAAAGMYNICLSVTVSCALSSSTCANYNIFRTVEIAASMVTVNVVPNASVPTGSSILSADAILWKLYPNPANDLLFFESEHTNRQTVEIVIRNIVGKVVFRDRVKADENRFMIDLSDLPAGMYFFECEIGGYLVKEKIILVDR